MFLLAAFSDLWGSRRGKVEDLERTDGLLETNWLGPSVLYEYQAFPLLGLQNIFSTSRLGAACPILLSSTLRSSPFLCCPKELLHRVLTAVTSNQLRKKKSGVRELENDLHFFIPRNIWPFF